MPLHHVRFRIGSPANVGVRGRISTRTREGTRARDGRVLAECIVALALLTIGLLASTAMSRASLLLSGNAQLLSTALGAANARAEATTVEACAGGNVNASALQPRITLNWVDAASPATRQRHIDVAIAHSPLERRAGSLLTMDAAGVCPQ